MKTIFPFQRYWCELSESIPLDEFGFLRDPESEWFHIYFEKPVFKTDSLINKNCLLLLGEPGIGKSTELRKLRGHESANGSATVLFELRDFDSKIDLKEGIINNETVQFWLKDPCNPLSIYFDSLDEALLEAKRISVGVFEILKKLKQSGEILLRLACRTSDLPTDFTTQLKTIFEDSTVSFPESWPVESR